MCSWAARAVTWVGVEDALKGSVEVRRITLIAHVGGKESSNVGMAKVTDFCVDTIEPLEMGEDTKAGKRDP